MIEEMKPDVAQRYVEARHKIDENANLICALSEFISAFKNCSDDQISISPKALGILHCNMNSNMCEILDLLENFMPLREVEKFLEEHNQKDQS